MLLFLDWNVIPSLMVLNKTLSRAFLAGGTFLVEWESKWNSDIKQTFNWMDIFSWIFCAKESASRLGLYYHYLPWMWRVIVFKSTVQSIRGANIVLLTSNERYAIIWESLNGPFPLHPFWVLIREAIAKFSIRYKLLLGTDNIVNM